MEGLSCSISDDPPTSTVVLDRCHFSQVIFTNVEKFYVPGADITCHYNLSEYIIPRGKDWVGIFKVGWKTTREYYTFMWAPLPSSSNSAEHEQILFKAYYLPKDDEYYQFCYVDQDGIVRGASVPFQFRAAAEDDMLVVTTQGEVEEIEQQNKSLFQENQKLKETLTSLQKQNEDLQEQIRKAQETAKELEDKVHLLQSGTMELQRAQDLQALEICSTQKELAAIQENNIKFQEENQDLKRSLAISRSDNETLDLEAKRVQGENTRLEIQNRNKEAELCQIKEENKKLLTEKEKLENKLKATLGCMHQLQSQVCNEQKEVEKLQSSDHDKARFLEKLKEENDQLYATLLRQENYDNLEKELEEKTLLLHTLQKEKDEMELESQRLKQENEDLMAHLPEVLQDVPAGLFAQPSENAALVFGNPYSTTPEHPDPELVSLKKCPVYNEVFPCDIGEQYSDHVQSNLLSCPYCEETFDRSSKQVYDDHIYCHGLDLNCSLPTQ
ncbi:calcium-binding and coiled-coil domain-containing protein 2 [Eublepharis macularius]|uniref:Calcium-binding and coiled-coil domain-containing protein 2 n=1 Tax=Eublepharis macularius TaxID=481883 RepID=A0AA97K9W2_EUBMA|nr:calcium-binding and coiled-coil domain-containing protein 2 [Eublepharis macularius]